MLGLAQLGHHGSDQGKELADNREYEARSQARVKGTLFKIFKHTRLGPPGGGCPLAALNSAGRKEM